MYLVWVGFTDHLPYTPNVSVIPNPPETVDSVTGKSCTNREVLSPTSLLAMARAVPLTFTDLGTAGLTNNRAACSVSAGYCIENFPIPGMEGHAMGWTLEGFELMPFATPSGPGGLTGRESFARCEIGPCGDHVPEGGAGIHFHADPFGSKCLYS